jgi:hypothetical protein
MKYKQVIIISILIIFSLISLIAFYKNALHYKKSNFIKITSKNLIIVTTTLNNCKTSECRRKNLEKNLINKYNLNIIFNEGITKNYNKVDKFFDIDLQRLISFKQSGYKYGLICDDDFNPIDNFLEELNKTIELLPNNWTCLHLCPGFLWGRQFRNINKIGKLNPEGDISLLKYHNSGRFYEKCDPDLYYKLKIFCGAPEAFIINNNSIDKFIKKFQKLHIELKLPTDVILTKMLDKNSFICRSPLLGYENECGGSTFSI